MVINYVYDNAKALTCKVGTVMYFLRHISELGNILSLIVFFFIF